MPEQSEAVVEAAKNCAECKKSISKAKRYYRNGAYYCNKNCFQKKMAALAKESISSQEAEKSKKAEAKENPPEAQKTEEKPKEAQVKEESKEETQEAQAAKEPSEEK